MNINSYIKKGKQIQELSLYRISYTYKKIIEPYIIMISACVIWYPSASEYKIM